MNPYGVDKVAEICHEANKAICEAYGDFSQKHWIDAEDWQKESAVRGVIFTVTNPNALPEDQHNAWMAAKLADNWIWGPVKDTKAKVHPCIVPYAELPTEQRIKDHVFCAIVKSMMDIPA